MGHIPTRFVSGCAAIGNLTREMRRLVHRAPELLATDEPAELTGESETRADFGYYSCIGSRAALLCPTLDGSAEVA